MGEVGDCLSREEDLDRPNLASRLVAKDLTAFEWAYWDSSCQVDGPLSCLRADKPCDTGCYRSRVSLDAMREGGPAYLGLPAPAAQDALQWAGGIVAVAKLVFVAAAMSLVLGVVCACIACRRCRFISFEALPDDFAEEEQRAYRRRIELQKQRLGILQGAILACAAASVVLLPCAHFLGSAALAPALHTAVDAPVVFQSALRNGAAAARAALDIPERALSELAPLNQTLDLGLSQLAPMRAGLACASAALAATPAQPALRLQEDLRRLNSGLARITAPYADAGMTQAISAVAGMRPRVTALAQNLSFAAAALTEVVETNVLGRLANAAVLVFDNLQGGLRYPVIQARELLVVAAEYHNVSFPTAAGMARPLSLEHHEMLDAVYSKLQSFQSDPSGYSGEGATAVANRVALLAALDQLRGWLSSAKASTAALQNKIISYGNGRGYVDVSTLMSLSGQIVDVASSLPNATELAQWVMQLNATLAQFGVATAAATDVALPNYSVNSSNVSTDGGNATAMDSFLLSLDASSLNGTLELSTLPYAKALLVLYNLSYASQPWEQRTAGLLLPLAAQLHSALLKLRCATNSTVVAALNAFNSSIVHPPPSVALPLLSLQAANNGSAAVNTSALGDAHAAIEWHANRTALAMQWTEAAPAQLTAVINATFAVNATALQQVVADFALRAEATVQAHEWREAPVLADIIAALGANSTAVPDFVTQAFTNASAAITGVLAEVNSFFVQVAAWNASIAPTCESMLHSEYEAKLLSCSLVNMASSTAVDCVGTWGEWSSCNASCGSGTEHRFYSVGTQARNSGGNCAVGAGAEQRRSCNSCSCLGGEQEPELCVRTLCVGSWSAFGSCSAICGGGAQAQSYSAALGANGSMDGCTASHGSVRYRACNTNVCGTPWLPSNDSSCIPCNNATLDTAAAHLAPPTNGYLLNLTSTAGRTAWQQPLLVANHSAALLAASLSTSLLALPEPEIPTALLLSARTALELPPLLADAFHVAKPFAVDEVAVLSVLEAALDGLLPAFDPLADLWPSWYPAAIAAYKGVATTLPEVDLLVEATVGLPVDTAPGCGPVLPQIAEACSAITRTASANGSASSTSS